MTILRGLENREEIDKGRREEQERYRERELKEQGRDYTGGVKNKKILQRRA